MTQRRKRIGEDFVFKNWGEGEGVEAEISPNPEEKYTFINVGILEIKKKEIIFVNSLPFLFENTF